jgi:hypothetical protein
MTQHAVSDAVARRDLRGKHGVRQMQWCELPAGSNEHQTAALCDGHIHCGINAPHPWG